ncbi:DUF58 domain-containing protein [Sporolactobacillus terrae]|uniref:DUF58 domain-containing protein n=1 Tax=Sporolactobacillus terrae TaxID=269673 RepID=A0ABX5Q6Z7_9BACL|nr:DUF58 domain-containing protein [Sporolactobacillus terrae]QAA22412.1 DUF58 domain-containing protein [Sporolactobacillus terrae]QAA25387.1 DUF58 domain-containing protein [Sporolactobacillus terrae]UAK17196.1 DUF58 domain-containing protein [Sporolactobacillus terrae]
MKGYATDWQSRNQTLFYFFGTLVFFVGFIGNSFLCSLTGLIFVICAFLSKWYVLNMIRTFVIENQQHDLRLSVGDERILKISLENRSPIPFFSLKGRIAADKNVVFPNDNSKGQNSAYSFTITGPAHGKVIVHCPVTALQRGIARVRSLEFICSDPLHIVRCSIHFDQFLKSNVVVYPDPEPVHQLNLIPPQISGTRSAKHSLYHDVSAPSGIRDYTYSDPFKYVHWKASARTGRLQTKTFEQVADQNWMFLFLNQPNSVHHQPLADFEQRVAAAAWLAQEACRRTIDTSLYCNTKSIGQQMIGIESGKGEVQLRKTWELLAFIQAWQMKTPITQALKWIDRKLGQPQILIFLTLDQPELAAPFLEKWLKTGHQLFMLRRVDKRCILEQVEKGASAVGSI